MSVSDLNVDVVNDEVDFFEKSNGEADKDTHANISSVVEISCDDHGNNSFESAETSAPMNKTSFFNVMDIKQRPSNTFKCTYCSVTMPSENSIRLHEKWKHSKTMNNSNESEEPLPKSNGALRTVKLLKNDSNTSYGFTIYTKAGCGHFVHTIAPGSQADRASIQVGNCILEINEKSVMKFSSAEICDMMKENASGVTLYLLTSVGRSYMTKSKAGTPDPMSSPINDVKSDISDACSNGDIASRDGWNCDSCNYKNSSIHTKYCFSCKKLKVNSDSWTCTICCHDNPEMYKLHCFSCKKPKNPELMSSDNSEDITSKDGWNCDSCTYRNSSIHTKYCFSCKKLKVNSGSWTCALCCHDNPEMYKQHCFSCKKPKQVLADKIKTTPLIPVPPLLQNSPFNGPMPQNGLFNANTVSSVSFPPSMPLFPPSMSSFPQRIPLFHPSMSSFPPPSIVPIPTSVPSYPPPLINNFVSPLIKKTIAPPIKSVGGNSLLGDPPIGTHTQTKDEEMKGVPRTLTLYKYPTYDGYGFRILRDVKGYYINSVEVFSPAYSANLKEGDRLLYINDNDISSCSLDKIHSLISFNSAYVKLHVKTFPLPKSSSDSLEKKGHVKDVKLFKRPDQASYGFSIDTRGDTHFVYEVEAGSPADVAALKRNDCILEVNDIPAVRMPYESIVAIVKRSPTYLVMKISCNDEGNQKRPSNNDHRGVSDSKYLKKSEEIDYKLDVNAKHKTEKHHGFHNDTIRHRTAEHDSILDKEKFPVIPTNIKSEDDYLKALQASKELHEALSKFKENNSKPVYEMHEAPKKYTERNSKPEYKTHEAPTKFIERNFEPEYKTHLAPAKYIERNYRPDYRTHEAPAKFIERNSKPEYITQRHEAPTKLIERNFKPEDRTHEPPAKFIESNFKPEVNTVKRTSF